MNMESDSIADYDDSQLDDLDESDLTETKQCSTPKPVPSITLKKQPELLCNCPLHCDNKIGKEWRGIVYKQFQDIVDHALQNQYIQRHIKIKSIAKRLWEDEIIEKKIQRRVTCKYLIPMSGTVMESFNYAKTLTYDSVRFSLYLPVSKENESKLPIPQEVDSKVSFPYENGYKLPASLNNGSSLLASHYPPVENGCLDLSKDSIETHKTNNCITENTTSIQTDTDSPMPEIPAADTKTIICIIESTTSLQTDNDSPMPEMHAADMKTINSITENTTSTQTDDDSPMPEIPAADTKTIHCITTSIKTDDDSPMPKIPAADMKTTNCITENTTSVQTANDSPMPEIPAADTNTKATAKNGVLQQLLNDSPMLETSFGDTSTVNSVLKDLLNSTRSNNTTKENAFDANSPISFNDSDSVNTVPDDLSASELDSSIPPTNVKYVEVCQKAFMNMYGITEKRIRWQREKLILKSRFLAEKKRRELEEMDRTLSLARSLGAGCQPLFALLEKSNCAHLSEQLMGAIEDDVALVNNFFQNQLWKPEDIMNKSVHFPS